MGRERLQTEFGDYAEWLADAIALLGIEDPVPAACRGTGNPALFEHLAESVGARPEMPFLDVGCGIGGPGAWLAREKGCRVIGVDVMEAGVRGARKLFPGSLALVASTRVLPFADDTFAGAWALGVLETIADKPGALRELDRVLAPGARVAIFTYLLSREASETPSADRFETESDFRPAIESSGLVIEDVRVAETPPAPRDWSRVSKASRAAIADVHANDPLLLRVEEERAKIGALVRSGAVVPWIYILRKEKR